MDFSSFLSQILFVIVLYQKKAHELDSFRLLANERANVFLHDNSTESSPVSIPGIHYAHDPSNGGVAKAYNAAFKTAISLGKKWLLLLDQDTELSMEYLHKLNESLIYDKKARVLVPQLYDELGFVSPFRWSWGSGKRISPIAMPLDLEKFRFLNSGALIHVEAFAACGGYDEQIPLYFSDIAFGEKLRQVTGHFTVVDAKIKHGLSASESQTAEAALHRYHYFRVGAFKMGETLGRYWLYYFRALLRGLKLSLRYRHPGFLKIFFTSGRW